MARYRPIAMLAASALAVAAAGPAGAQEYPAKPVRIIVPLAPGGLGDKLKSTL